MVDMKFFYGNEKRKFPTNLLILGLLVISVLTNFIFMLHGSCSKDATTEPTSAGEAKKVAAKGDTPATSESSSDSGPDLNSGDDQAPGDGDGLENAAVHAVENGSMYVFAALITGGSLAQTISQFFEPQDVGIVGAYLERVFGWQIDLNRDLRKNDDLRFVYTKPDDYNRFKVVAGMFQSSKLGKAVQIYYFQKDKEPVGGYYDETGKELYPRIVDREAPIRIFEEITSRIGEKRGGRKMHNGIDFKTPVGTPVYAPFDGKVINVNWNFGSNGDCIKIDHPQFGVFSIFLHLNKVDVTIGQNVKQGQKIAESGNTGKSFAPHLHYELRTKEGDKGKVINPFTWEHHKTYYRQVASADEPAFKQTVEKYRKLMNAR